MLQANKPIFVYENTHIINIKYIDVCRPTMIKENRGLSSTR